MCVYTYLQPDANPSGWLYWQQLTCHGLQLTWGFRLWPLPKHWEKQRKRPCMLTYRYVHEFNVYGYIYIYICVFIRLFVYIYIHVLIFVYIVITSLSLCMCMYIYIDIQTESVHVCAYAYIYMRPSNMAFKTESSRYKCKYRLIS